jgi:integrase/recombinase XerC
MTAATAPTIKRPTIAEARDTLPRLLTAIDNATDPAVARRLRHARGSLLGIANPKAADVAPAAVTPEALAIVAWALDHLGPVLEAAADVEIDAPQADAPEVVDAELLEPEPVALATVAPVSPATLALQAAAARRDPFAQALQDQLGAESRDAYRRDLAHLARWLATEAGTVAPGSMTAAEVFDALRPLLELGPLDTRALIGRWLADLTRAGLAGATINRRLSAVRWFARQAELAGAAPLGLDALRSVKAEARRDMAGPSGAVALGRLVRVAGQQEDPATAARDRAVLLLLATNGLRRGEITRLALADVAELAAGRLWIRGKARTEREAVTITPVTAAAIGAWLELRPDWAPAEPWAPLFVGLDNRAQARVATVREAVAVALAGELAEVAPQTGAWWAVIAAATAPLALSGSTVWRIVQALGDGAPLSPHRVRHGAVTTLVRDAGLSMTDAQHFARHRDPRVTQRYFDAAGEVQAKATAALGELIGAT